ncbi:MAG: hypothetical protein AAFO95_13540 [Cyanobacteria bacterium J06600_6]
MTTIVKHRRTGNQYILLGINGEINQANPSRFISELFNQEKSAVAYSASVCDVQGNMFLAYIDDLIVVEIDGVKPADILPNVKDESRSSDGDRDFAEFDSEEFDDDDFESGEIDEQQPLSASGASLDAPNSENSEDEDWI